MVCEWGMSEKLGPLTFGKKEEQIFLGREIAQHRDYSEQTAILIDNEVQKIIRQNYDISREMLETNRDALERIAQALLEYEVLDAEEIDLVIKGEPIRQKKDGKEGDASRSATDAKEKAAQEKVGGMIKPKEGHATA
jgi:cell division protease FtsH